ncbi:MAG: hypothetical protein JWR77_2471 [Rhizorhabdus sp.]|nr:hypothetical protein [Rhizorhabdus sp.]
MSGTSPPRMLWGAALLLPLIALAFTWATAYRMAQQGQEWLIPIKGYDPRDLLRGHYIQYRYDWPMAAGPDDLSNFDPAYAGALCVEGIAPHITRVRALVAAPRCAIVVRAAIGNRREVRGLDTGIFFTSEAGAQALSARLTNPGLQALIRVRIRADGVMRPIAMSFRPRAAGS